MQKAGKCLNCGFNWNMHSLNKDGEHYCNIYPGVKPLQSVQNLVKQ